MHILPAYGTKYSRMDGVRFVKDNLWNILKTWVDINGTKYSRMDQVKICGRQPLKDFKYFKDCLPHILLAPFLREWERERGRGRGRASERETERDRERQRETEHNLLISDNNSLFLLQINTEYYFQK